MSSLRQMESIKFQIAVSCIDIRMRSFLFRHFIVVSRLSFYLHRLKMHSLISFFSIIVDKIDENKDALINLSELKNWIQFTQRRYLEEDVDRQWRQHNPNKSDEVNWEVS